MPEMTICPVSSFSRVVKVGSSFERISRVSLSFSRSERVLGSMATEITGSGKCIFSRSEGPALGADRVARLRELHAHDHGDVAGLHLVHRLGLVGVHAQEARYALALLLVLVVDRARVLDATPSTCARSRGARPRGRTAP